MKKTELSNLQIVVIAVARLGGDSQSVHTEDVAIEAASLAPGRFTWRKYPERIDLELVRRSLARVAEKDPPLLVGSVRRGWMLSKHGIRWIEKNATNLPTLVGYRRGSIANAIDMERVRLRETRAWQKYKAGSLDEINLNDLFEFVRMNEYFSDVKRRERLNIVANAVDGDVKLAKLWQFLTEKFPKETQAKEQCK